MASGLNLSPVNGNGSFVDYTSAAMGNLDSVFIIVSHPKLIDAPATGVMQYANFRRTGMNGGNYNTIVASINDLYDQLLMV